MTIIISNSTNDEDSECPTEFSEETVLTSATASKRATASALRYRVSWYADTRDGIVIVAPISDIAQHW